MGKVWLNRGYVLLISLLFLVILDKYSSVSLEIFFCSLSIFFCSSISSIFFCSSINSLVSL